MHVCVRANDEGYVQGEDVKSHTVIDYSRVDFLSIKGLIFYCILYILKWWIIIIHTTLLQYLYM